MAKWTKMTQTWPFWVIKIVQSIKNYPKNISITKIMGPKNVKKNCLNKCALFKKLEFFNNEIDTGMICIVKVFLEKFK